MKTALNFEHDDTKALLAKLDFEFFLKQNIEAEKYNQADIDSIYTSYNKSVKEIKTKAQADKKQFNYYTEGYPSTTPRPTSIWIMNNFAPS